MYRSIVSLYDNEVEGILATVHSHSSNASICRSVDKPQANRKSQEVSNEKCRKPENRGSTVVFGRTDFVLLAQRGPHLTASTGPEAGCHAANLEERRDRSQATRKSPVHQDDTVSQANQEADTKPLKVISLPQHRTHGWREGDTGDRESF